MRVLPAMAPLLLGVSLVVSLVLPAQASESSLCSPLLRDAQRELDSLELEISLAETESGAAREIHQLAEALWQSDNLERLFYLGAKHEHEVSELRVQRARLIVKRQQALVRELEALCSSGADARDRTAAARRDYLQADCHRMGKDLAIAEIDLAYLTEVRDSVLDLRRNDVATRQEVIRAERDAEMASQRVAHWGPRVQACIESGAAAGDLDR